MARKRKLAKSQTTPTKSDIGSQTESEPASQPGSQPKSEPMEEAPIVNNERAPEETEPERQLKRVKEEPLAEEEIQEMPQTVENTESTPAEEEGGEEETEPEHQLKCVKEEPLAEEQLPLTVENTDPTPAEEEDEVEEDETDPSSIRKILELFSKDQLLDLLSSAASNHPDVCSEVLRVADEDPSHRKIFVHGLSWDTSANAVIDFFRQYGDIEDCKAVTDKITGKSKGYAFILFKHRRGAQKALKQPQKKIGSRMAACQLASAGPAPSAAPPVSQYTQRKIFVSNVSADLDPQKLLEFFSKFGEIEEGPMGLDKVTGKPKGFCLFVYKTVESAKKALEEPHKNFDGQVLHCQKAVDVPKGNKQLSYGPGPWPNAGFVGGATSGGHLMAPSRGGLGFGQVVPQATVPGLDPAVGLALTNLLVNQGAAGMGLTNVLGHGAPTGNAGMQGGYGNQGYGSYGYPPQAQGGYGNAHTGQGRGRPPYNGR